MRLKVDVWDDDSGASGADDRIDRYNYVLQYTANTGYSTAITRRRTLRGDRTRHEATT